MSLARSPPVSVKHFRQTLDSNDPIGISGGLNQYCAFENDPVNKIDPWGLNDVLATTYRFGPYTFTRYHSDFYKLTPEEKMATIIHEDFHRYDPNQQSLAVWNNRQHEVNAYTREINWTKGQIALLTKQKNCLSEQTEITRLNTSIQNFKDSMMNAEEELSYYKNTSGWQNYLNHLKSLYGN